MTSGWALLAAAVGASVVLAAILPPWPQTRDEFVAGWRAARVRREERRRLAREGWRGH